MNRILLIGNGFDRAHNLQTTYEQFAKSKFIQAIKYLENDLIFEDTLIKIDRRRAHSKIILDNDIDKVSLNKIYNHCLDYNYSINFLNKLYHTNWNHLNSETLWVDFERSYYTHLKYNLKPNISQDDLSRVKELNKDLDLIKNSFIEYLKNEYQRQFSLIKPIKALKDKIYENVRSSWEITATSFNKINKVFAVNFNYTDTFKDHYLNDMAEEIPIHGKLEPPHSVIFGYGDEIDKDYEKIEELNENAFLQNIKSFKYLNNKHYQYLSDIINNDSFEVFILGHSLGLTDRTLLSHIFSHEKLERVIIFYVNKEDYESKTFNISRHFKDKIRFRTKVSNFDQSIVFPQLK